MRKAALVVIVCFSTAVMGQTSTFRWSDDSCRYAGVYDARKVTLTELRDTLKLSLPGSYNLRTNTTVWKFSDIDRIDVTAPDKEYKQTIAELSGLHIARSEYWQDFRKRKLRELEQVYLLERVTMLAYRDPSALSAFRDAPACMSKFGEPLIKGGDALLTAWRTVNEEARTKNVDPERLRRIYDQQAKSPDKFKYALLEVMTFGWSNCANELIPYIEYDGTPHKEFEKLFVSVTRVACNEP